VAGGRHCLQAALAPLQFYDHAVDI
jgi:hypothetical protein